MGIPAHLQPYLWSANVKLLDTKRDQEYIIHQLLQFGDLDAIAWLKSTYSLDQLRSVFQHSPKKIYTNRSFQFIKDFVLDLTNHHLDADLYVRD